MADRWYFSRERIRNCPSVRDGGIDCAKELGYRQQCASFIQDIGQRLPVSQLCINTSIVYMHRFYMFHSFKHFHRYKMAPCFIFLGAKVEEQPRKLEHVLKVAHKFLHKDSETQLDMHSDEYMEMAQDLIDNESILLQTLGFDLSVEHPHTYVVKCAQMVKAAKDLAQTSYFLATNSLHLTTFCIEEKPTVVACVCIFVACKWTSYEIPESHDKKHWWEYMDSNATIEKIEEMSSYFIKILDSSPTRLKKKILTGPVIYKGGAMQQKRDADGEHSKSGKTIDSNANKTNERTEGGSSRGSSQTVDRRNLVEAHNKRQDHHSEVEKDSNESSQTLKKHTKHVNQSDNDRKSSEHHKHHKRKHSDHGKHQGERVKAQDPVIKRPEDAKHEKQATSEAKVLSSSNRPVDASKAKTSQSESLSSAAKHILSLPPLHHKHSLPDIEKASQSESPAKRQKVDAVVMKKHKPDADGGKISGQADAGNNSSISSGNHSGSNTGVSSSSSSSSSSSNSHKKPKSSSEKHKMRQSSEKHSELYKHLQQPSEKSSHGQKHHSNIQEKISKEKKLEHHKSLSSRGSEGVEKHSSKSKSENVSLKTGEESKYSSELLGSHSSKQLPTPKKQSSNEKSHKISNSTPKKNGHSIKATSKSDSSSKEASLPPPPPPPSFNVSNMLPTQPPLPTEPEVKQKPVPAPPSNMGYNETGSVSQKYTISSSQAQALQTQMQGQLYSMQHQVMPNQQTLISQGYQQQSQQQYLTNPQTAASTANTFSTPQMYYQGQQDTQVASSDVSQAYWQSINTPNLFSPPNIGLVPQPPVPPQGLVIHQVDGLPPPPPLNLPPFPPRPT